MIFIRKSVIIIIEKLRSNVSMRLAVNLNDLAYGAIVSGSGDSEIEQAIKNGTKIEDHGTNMISWIPIDENRDIPKNKILLATVRTGGIKNIRLVYLNDAGSFVDRATNRDLVLTNTEVLAWFPVMTEYEGEEDN